MMKNAREKTFAAEAKKLQKQEEQMAQVARNRQIPGWKQELEQRIPEKIRCGLEAAFAKGFALVFEQGRGLIEKTCRKEERQADHAIRDYAIRLKGGRKELRQLHSGALRACLQNLVLTTAEGIGLGAMGIGMPDVVLFLSTLLKSIYETALNYGFEYESRAEQLLILKMIETAMSRGDAWDANHRQVNEMLQLETVAISDEYFRKQRDAAATALAMDMLLLKFIQGLPLVGILGGAANPVYHTRIMRYVRMMYRKRYLHKQRGAAAVHTAKGG